MKTPFTRLWHGLTPADRADEYLKYILETGVNDIRATRGNLGVTILRSKEDNVSHFWILSTWEDMKSIKAFAGKKPEKPRYYPRDAEFLLELEPRVHHCEVIEFGAYIAPLRKNGKRSELRGASHGGKQAQGE